MKVLEEGKADLKAAEQSTRKEAYDVAREDATSEILKYGMSFRRSSIFMIKQKYHELDLSDINLTLMHGYDVSNPTNGSEPIGDLNVGRSLLEIAANQPVKCEIQVENGNVDPNSPINNVSPQKNIENVINVASDQENQ